MAKLTNNPALPKPTVPLAQVTAAQVAFSNATHAALRGGKQNTAAKNAAYVQSVAGDDLVGVRGWLQTGKSVLQKKGAACAAPFV